MNKMCENRPISVLIGKNDNVIEELQKRGIRCIILENNNDIDPSVRNHADMAAFKLSENEILLDRRQVKAAEELEKLGFKVVFTREKITGAYPCDIILNAAKTGNTIICNEKYISPEITENAKEIISVKQGYTKCSVCIVSENALITDDIGIYEKCKDRFDVLLIEKGDIYLPDHDYGFIGGASANLSGKIIFFGSIETHRNYSEIKKFLDLHNAEYECLLSGRLIDIGGLIEL